jgi:hypothetical protein
MNDSENYKKQRIKINGYEESLLNIYELFTAYLLLNGEEKERYFKFFIHGSFASYVSIFEPYINIDLGEWDQVIKIYLYRQPHEIYYPRLFVATVKLIENRLFFLDGDNSLNKAFLIYIKKWSEDFTGCDSKEKFDEIYKKMAQHAGYNSKTRPNNDYYGIKK